MRNFTLLLLLISTITLFSCKKDPDEKASKNLVGKWYQKSSIDKTFKNGKLVHEESNTSKDNSVFVEYRSNGTGIDSDGDEFTYKVENSKLTIHYKGEDESDTEEIKKLNSSELVLYGEMAYPTEEDDIKYTWEVTYRK